MFSLSLVLEMLDGILMRWIANSTSLYGVQGTRSRRGTVEVSIPDSLTRSSQGIDWYSASQPPSGTPYLVGLPHMHHRGGGPYASGCDRIRLREVEKEVARASHSRPANCPSPTMVACFTAIFVDARGPKLTVCIDTPNYTDA